MNLKRYRVNNIKEALKFIKRDLGSDAMIVSTRQVKENTGAFGLFGKTMLEVTAPPVKRKRTTGPQFLPRRHLRHTAAALKLQKQFWPILFLHHVTNLCFQLQMKHGR